MIRLIKRKALSVGIACVSSVIPFAVASSVGVSAAHASYDNPDYLPFTNEQLSFCGLIGEKYCLSYPIQASGYQFFAGSYYMNGNNCAGAIGGELVSGSFWNGSTWQMGSRGVTAVNIFQNAAIFASSVNAGTYEQEGSTYCPDSGWITY